MLSQASVACFVKLVFCCWNRWPRRMHVLCCTSAGSQQLQVWWPEINANEMVSHFCTGDRVLPGRDDSAHKADALGPKKVKDEEAGYEPGASRCFS